MATVTQSKKELYFHKYDVLGAYHWEACSTDIGKMNAFIIERYRIIIDMLKAIGVTKDSIILDAGCGDGALLGMIYKELLPQVYGVDTSQTAVKLSQEMFDKHKYNGTFVHAVPYKYPFGDDYFDVVICAGVIEHVQQPEVLLRELQRIVKPGGYIILSTPIRFTKKPLSDVHAQEWFLEDFREFASSVLGEPIQRVISHPIFWYELYTSATIPFGKYINWSINLFAKCGKNVFSRDHKKRWKFNTMQTLLYKK